jgi:hypothetical protein
MKFLILNCQPIDCILATWPLGPRDHGKLLKITIFWIKVSCAKDNLQRCELAKGQIENTLSVPPTTYYGLIYSH